jgi:hypothetical protein
MEDSMEAASVAPVTATKSKRVTLPDAMVGVSLVGLVIGIVGMFLKAFNPPAEWVLRGWHGSTTYISTTGGAKITLASLVIGAIFLLVARSTHRKGILWGAYVFGVIAVGISAIALSGFKISGSSVTAKASVAVYVTLAGSIIMLVGALLARRGATPDA